ncbi:hypothetical protein BSZ22_01735 [Bradyrhizobium canariense]|uniref:Uncharacterized protein n=1 Tax=Bradyrhizobium canariense TaxID=255045 RepID=A0A1X3HF13_9BRAD|nr:hypothetical protein BSZ22_01735 [Bradyrhizobium canariense]OSI82399.1 hypothetical protein BSZ23_01670 [Bradyrhizobium canariense]OSI96807.1 hypothetical protein BSZ25_01360 [Bradyrhizobium canariense]OSI98821.1 hypothetical protein BSZ24_01275 [Bradyrhizobium canariense]OSJ16097.1 hypothetical protein BSZ16_01370 [Bradyrhizobium canariense]
MLVVALSTGPNSYLSAQPAKTKEIQDVNQDSSKTELLNKLMNALRSNEEDLGKTTESEADLLQALITRLQELFAKASPSPAEKTEIQQKLAALNPKLEELARTYQTVVGQLATNSIVPDSIGKQLTSKCGTAYGETLRLIQEKKLGSDKNASARLQECQAIYDLLVAQLNLQLATYNTTLTTLEAERRQLEAQLETATPEQRKDLQKKLDDNEAKAKEVQAQQKKTKEVKGKADWGKFALGALAFVVGVVLAIYGDEANGISFMIAGGKTMDEASNPKSKKEDYIVPAVVKREGVNPQTKPGDGKANEVIAALTANGLKNITSGSPSGNFIVLNDPEANTWLVYQIEPKLLVARIAPNQVQVQANGKKVSALPDIKEPQATELKDVDTAIKIRFSAKTADGAAITGGIAETGVVSRNYKVTVDDAPIPGAK